ncbi:hypothetical protein BU24DRAFT_489925 [Aaosphaeria arxii CBS 175.79]|uniref:Ubiquitin-like protease family profile domain-containing protein n=1 Tax=Aaosphaeria arxii CBS 175.79 TaxID=1450172 RepID=A0A6A5Y3H8_9PLEO|nr:uncharacterized protein BU24DRAFT_489925 [Aaosphaeria arxii CBS 175.79]KAF2020092.1 hypothetical protein BU24DRAFT_489925 [Aaosphaeria arxii CBS 175.79]
MYDDEMPELEDLDDDEDGNQDENGDDKIPTPKPPVKSPPPPASPPGQPTATSQNPDESADPCAYLRHRLNGLEEQIRTSHENHAPHGLNRSHTSQLIATVLLGINGLHTLASGGGFSIAVDAGRGVELRDPGRTLIMRAEHNGIPLLYVVQSLSADRISITFFSSVVYRFGLEDRRAIFNNCWATLQSLNWKPHLSEKEKPEHGFWMKTSTMIDEALQEKLLTLTAWALALNLSPNPDFVPNKQFAEETDNISYLALGGASLDWQIIRAFLRCHKFVHDEPFDVPAERRFSHAEYNINFSAFVNRTMQPTNVSSSGKSHEDGFAFDKWTDAERIQIIPRLRRRKLLKADQDAEDMGRVYKEQYPHLNAGKSKIVIDSWNEAHDIFQERFRGVPEPQDVLDSAAEISLGHQEVFDGIATIAVALNEQTNNAPSFALIEYSTLRYFMDPQVERRIEAPQVLFPGLPLLLPWSHGTHEVLVVVQPDVSSGNPVMFVVDPASWMLSADDRKAIATGVATLVNHTHWSQNSITISAKTWILNSTRSEAWHTGYYTLCHAWAILLGLTLRPQFRPKKSFFSEARQLLTLLHSGNVNWELVWAFLRFHDFVIDPKPPKERHFAVSTSRDRLKSSLHVLQSKDRDYRNLKAPPNKDVAYKFRNESKHSGTLGSDSWTTSDKERRVPLLLAHGILDASINRARLRARYRHLRLKPSDTFRLAANMTKMRSLLEPRGEKMNQLADLAVFKRFMEVFSPTCRPIFQDINDAPCVYWRRKLQLLRAVGDDLGVELPTGLKLDLDDIAVVNAISSVVEAIVQLQNDKSSLGGFASVSPQILRKARADQQPTIPIARPRRAWFFPYAISISQGVGDTGNDESATHFVLCIIQEEVHSGTSVFRRYILDPGKQYHNGDYSSSLEDIERIAHKVEWSTHRNEDQGVRFINFNNDTDLKDVAVQTQIGVSGIHAVLNAWICALDLTIEDHPTVQLNEKFYAEASVAIHFARAGVLGWAEITAFLICHGLIKERAIEAVPPSRRFILTSKRTAGDQGSQETRLRTWIQDDERIESTRPNCSLDPYDLGNNVSFGKFSRPPGSAVQPEHPAGDYGPSAHLTSEFKRLREDESAKEWVQLLESKLKTRRHEGRWLHDDEVTLAIASVTAAINHNAAMEQGLSMMGITDYRSCGIHDENAMDFIQPDIRFGRPKIFPIVHRDNFFLVVAYLNNKDEIVISILDSQSWRLEGVQARERVFQIALRIIQKTNWLRNISNFPEWPQHAIWATTAQQQNDWICGYYAIFNAWAIAMGAKLNSNFAPSVDFLKDAVNVINYARGGFLSWRTIIAFLDSHHFIEENADVAHYNRFGRTARIEDENELNQQVQELRKKEDKYWESQKNPDFSDIGHWNQVDVPLAKRHTEKFVSDEWDKATRTRILPDLIAWGRFKATNSREFLHYTHQEALSVSWESVRLGIDAFLKPKDRPLNCDTLLTSLGAKLNQNLNTPSTMRLENARRKSNPKQYAQERIDFLKLTRKRYGNVLFNKSRKPHQMTRAGDLFLDEDTVLALAAVVQALPVQGEDLATGFSLASSFHVSASRCLDDYGQGRATRPRSCWLIPYVIDDDFLDLAPGVETPRENKGSQANKMGHIFLVVVQDEPKESEPGEREFRTYFLDSFEGIFEDSRVFIYERVKVMARNLKWTKFNHEGDAVPIKFGTFSQLVTVPRQSNGWACGVHTVLNAWILVLGLRINQDKYEYEEEMYEEAIDLMQLAVSGLLDWKTLASWLIANDLVTDEDFNSVQENRRFTLTQFQSKDNGFEYDDVFEGCMKSCPDLNQWDCTSNYDFNRLDVSIVDDNDSFIFPSPQATSLPRPIEDFGPIEVQLIRKRKRSDLDWYGRLFGKSKRIRTEVDVGIEDSW